MTYPLLRFAKVVTNRGYSSKEAATTMASVSSKFAIISPGASVDEMQTGLISMMKAYKVSTQEVEREILDNVNTLGKKNCPNL